MHEITSTMVITENNFTSEDPTELTTTAAVHRTTGSSMTSSSSRGAGLYFQCAVVIIGVVGAAANGLILYALVASKQHRKHALIALTRIATLHTLVVTRPTLLP